MHERGSPGLDGESDEFEFFLEKAWSDGLPVVTPTEARVAHMLSGTHRDPGERVGAIPPALNEATVRTVAKTKGPEWHRRIRMASVGPREVAIIGDP